MRAILIAMLIAIGIALVGTSNTSSAAPLNGPAIGGAVDTADVVNQVQHWRYGSEGGHGRDRSHWRYGSRGPRCETVCRHRSWSSERVCVRRC